MPAKIVATVLDEKGKTSTVFSNIPTTFTAAQALEAATDFVSLIDALIKGQVTSVGLCYEVTLPAGIKATPDADSDVEEGALFIWGTELGHTTKMRLPTFDETYIVAGSKQVDLAAAAVAAFTGVITAGTPVVGAATVPFTDTRDEDITTLRSAREMFVKDRG